MLDRDYIIANRPEIESILKTKKIKLDIDCLYKTIRERKTVINELNCIRNEKNSISKKIAEYKKQKSDCSELFKESKIIAEKTKQLNDVLRNIEEREMEMMKWIPNIPHKSVPSGENAKFEIIRECGSFDRKELSYDAITEKTLNVGDLKDSKLVIRVEHIKASIAMHQKISEVTYGLIIKYGVLDA